MHTASMSRGRLVGLLLAAILAVSSVAVGVKPAFADSTLCSGNDWTTCPSLSYTDHGYGAHSGNSYWGAYVGHNCTNYAAYMEQVINGATTSTHGNASEWDNNAPAGSVNTTPSLGSVAQWESNHVAYVESIAKDGSGNIQSITVSEDNWISGLFRWRVIANGSSNWPDHFIHFKDVTVVNREMLTPTLVQRSNGESDVVAVGPNNRLDFYYNPFGTSTWGLLRVR